MRDHQQDSHVRRAQAFHLEKAAHAARILISLCAVCGRLIDTQDVDPVHANLSHGVCRSVACLVEGYGVSEARAARYLAGKAA